MNNNKQILIIAKYSIIVLGLIIVINLPSCDFSPCYRNLGTHTTNTVKVDRVELTRDTLSSNETEQVRLWDTIGTNSGYTFKGFQVARNGNSIELTLRNALDINCGATVKDTLLIMSNYAYIITPPLTTGPNIVTVHQPDGSSINRYFFVR